MLQRNPQSNPIHSALKIHPWRECSTFSVKIRTHLCKYTNMSINAFKLYVSVHVSMNLP